MAKYNLQNLFGIAFFAFMALPIIAFNSHHDCHYDECFRIYYNDRVGGCVEKAIDDLYSVIIVVWWFSIYGAMIVWSKQKNAVSPFVIIGILIGLAVFGAFIAPAKWTFVIALLPSLAILVTAVVIDNKYTKEYKSDNKDK
jgi:hypothetical protein